MFNPNKGELSKKFNNFVIESPETLVTLGDSGWDLTVIDKITTIFKSIGLDDPLTQKFVHPVAYWFGGTRSEYGEIDLSNVNWEKILMYFGWEALHLNGDEKEANDIKKEFKNRFNEDIWSYGAYSIDMD